MGCSYGCPTLSRRDQTRSSHHTQATHQPELNRPGSGGPGSSRAPEAVSVSLPQMTHFSNNAPVSESVALVQRWAPTRHNSRSITLIRASRSRDRSHAHTPTTHRRQRGRRATGPHLTNTLVQPRVDQLTLRRPVHLRPATLMKLFTSPGSPEHTQFYPRAKPTRSDGTRGRAGQASVRPSSAHRLFRSFRWRRTQTPAWSISTTRSFRVRGRTPAGRLRRASWRFGDGGPAGSVETPHLGAVALPAIGGTIRREGSWFCRGKRPGVDTLIQSTGVSSGGRTRPSLGCDCGARHRLRNRWPAGPVHAPRQCAAHRMRLEPAVSGGPSRAPFFASSPVTGGETAALSRLTN